MALTPWFEPGPHWWEASALTRAPSLYLDLQIIIFFAIFLFELFYSYGLSVCEVKKISKKCPINYLL